MSRIYIPGIIFYYVYILILLDKDNSILYFSHYMMITGNIHAPDLGVVGAQGPDQNPCPRPTNPGSCLVFVCHSLKWFLFAHAFCKYISFVCVWHLFKVRTSLFQIYSLIPPFYWSVFLSLCLLQPYILILTCLSLF